MKGLSVPEAAAEMGVSDVRVRQLITAGRLDAERVGGRWVVDAASLRRSAPVHGRPMSARVAWAMLLDPEPDEQWLRTDEASRLRARRNKLLHAEDPVALLRSWTSRRSEDHHMHAQDAADLLADERLVPSGVSDPRSGMSAGGFAEAYVRIDVADDVVADHLLVPASRARANVLLHVSPILPPNPVPDLIVVADLASADGPREDGRARELFSKWVRQLKRSERAVECDLPGGHSWGAAVEMLGSRMRAELANADLPLKDHLPRKLVSTWLIEAKKMQSMPAAVECNSPDDWAAVVETLKKRMNAAMVSTDGHLSQDLEGQLKDALERVLDAGSRDLERGWMGHECNAPDAAHWDSVRARARRPQ